MTEQETLQFVNNTELIIDGETWKQHPTYTNYYASNLGRVKYINRYGKELIKIQSLCPQRKRFRISITSNGHEKKFMTARFICECFYGIRENLHVDHINTIRYDNRIENLRFCTPSENRNNPNTKAKGCKRTFSNIQIEQYDKNGELIKIWENGFIQLNEEKGITNTQRKRISENCNGKTKSAYGYVWRFTKPKDIDGEVWKPYLKLNGFEVSNKGRVRYTLKNGQQRILRGSLKSGVFYIKYDRKLYLKHRMIAETFLPNEQNYPYVYHLDGNLLNNDLNNLAWGDYGKRY